MVIENGPGILELFITLIFEGNGHIVISSMDSSVAKDVQTIVPDLILIDHLLGDSYGSYLCKKLKEDPIISNTPIILISAVNGLTRSLKMPVPMDVC